MYSPSIHWWCCNISSADLINSRHCHCYNIKVHVHVHVYSTELQIIVYCLDLRNFQSLKRVTKYPWTLLKVVLDIHVEELKLLLYYR